MRALRAFPVQVFLAQPEAQLPAPNDHPWRGGVRSVLLTRGRVTLDGRGTGPACLVHTGSARPGAFFATDSYVGLTMCREGVSVGQTNNLGNFGYRDVSLNPHRRTKHE